MAGNQPAEAPPEPEPLEYVRIDPNSSLLSDNGKQATKGPRISPTAAVPPPPEFIPDDSSAIAVCLSPDVCRSPTAPVPYMVWGKADDKQNYSPDVKSNGKVIKRSNSQFTATYGDQPGTGLGVKSGTVGNIVTPVTSSNIVRANGIPVQRHTDRCTLNNGNCPGEYVYVQSTETDKAPDATDKQNQSSGKTQDTRSTGEKFADGFTENASETWDGVKKVSSNLWDGTKNLASDLWNDPGGTVAAGAESVKDGAVGAANWTAEVGQNLYDNPGAPLARGWDNTTNTASSIWHGVADPYSEAYAKGGLAQAAGHGTFDVVKLAVEALATKGAVTVAGKTASVGASVFAKAHRAEEVAETVNDARRIEGKIEDGAQGARSTKLDPEKSPKKKLSKEEYDKLRKKTPSQAMRDKVNEGQPVATPENPVDDPWLPGKQRTGPLEADHIVSMKNITEMDGCADLSTENQLKVLNNPDNFTGLSKSANSSKGAKSFEDWIYYGQGDDRIAVNSTLRQQMIERSNQIRPQLQQQINDLSSGR